MKTGVLLAVLVLLMLLMTGCAPGPNELIGTSASAGGAAGFWKGLWHGFISLFTFIISLFNDNVSVYEVRNNGAWYNFGFLLGIMCFYGGSGGEASRRSR